MLRGGWLALFFAGFSLISLSNRALGQSAPVLREVIADHPQLPMPFGFAFTPDRALIVSDYKKHQIVRVDPGQTPRVKVLAGNGTAGNSAGTGSRAQLNSPHDVVRLADGTRCGITLCIDGRVLLLRRGVRQHHQSGESECQQLALREGRHQR